MLYNKFEKRSDFNVPKPIINPTHCRYCGERVVYYEKEHPSSRKSKVFFQELGAPWPIHRCHEFLNTDKAKVHICWTRSINIYWVKRGHDVWYRLDGLPKNIVSLRYKGVYIIWYFDRLDIVRTVKVGSGQLGACLAAEHRNPQVQRYADRTLHVTWALVQEDDLDRIASSLSQKLEPFVGEVYSGDTQVIVELPSTLRWY